MIRLAPSVLLALLISLAGGLPALAQDEPLPRTPWQKAEPASGETVRWVVEGCAAYPVTMDAEAPRPAPASDVVADAPHRPLTR